MSMDYIEYLESLGIKAKKYIVGNETTDGHTHTFYLRDDLPRATTADAIANDVGYHQHSIVPGPEKSLICEPAGNNNHIHTEFKLVQQ